VTAQSFRFLVKPGDTQGMDSVVAKINDYWFAVNRTAHLPIKKEPLRGWRFTVEAPERLKLWAYGFLPGGWGDNRPYGRALYRVPLWLRSKKKPLIAEQPEVFLTLR